jgi:hypothetical protein
VREARRRLVLSLLASSGCVIPDGPADRHRRVATCDAAHLGLQIGGCGFEGIASSAQERDEVCASRERNNRTLLRTFNITAISIRCRRDKRATFGSRLDLAWIPRARGVTLVRDGSADHRCARVERKTETTMLAHRIVADPSDFSWDPARSSEVLVATDSLDEATAAVSAP